VIFDTDILIHAGKGHKGADSAINAHEDRYISIQSVMELFQDALNTAHLNNMKGFLADLRFSILPITENIGHRALIYIEEYGLSHGLRSGDALIAATAVENNLPLMTGNARHFKSVKDLKLVPFKS